MDFGRRPGARCFRMGTRAYPEADLAIGHNGISTAARTSGVSRIFGAAGHRRLSKKACHLRKYENCHHHPVGSVPGRALPACARWYCKGPYPMNYLKSKSHWLAAALALAFLAGLTNSPAAEQEKRETKGFDKPTAR